MIKLARKKYIFRNEIKEILEKKRERKWTQGRKGGMNYK